MRKSFSNSRKHLKLRCYLFASQAATVVTEWAQVISARPPTQSWCSRPGKFPISNTV